MMILSMIVPLLASIPWESDSGNELFLLLLGPAGAAGVYWGLYRYYRNTDKSHHFERETRVEAKPITGYDAKVGEKNHQRNSRMAGENVRTPRERVQRAEFPGT